MKITVAEAFRRFEDFANFERSPADISGYRLDRIAAMFYEFGNPEESCKIVHIAGSKGKGSTAHICAQILHAAGHSVGMYLSPHVTDYRERICRPDGFFADATYIAVLDEIYNWAVTLPTRNDWTHGAPTTFEMLTLAAFMIFKREGLEWAIAETGLGGRLDATNAIRRPVACLISAIELEHTEILGDTVEKIAGEKAGIFKPGAVLIVQKQSVTIMDVFRRRAEEIGSDLEITEPGRWDVAADGNGRISLRIPTRQESSGSASATIEISATTGLWGQYQAMNASLAASAIVRLWERGLLSNNVDIKILANAMTQGISVASPPGRLERYSTGDKHVEVILDVAHTPNSAREALACAQTLASGRKINLVFGSVQGKRHEEMAEILAPVCKKIWITKPGVFKLSDPQAVFEAFRHRARGLCELELDGVHAVTRACEESAQDEALLLICGSFYLAGLVLPRLVDLGYKKIICL